MNDTIPIIPKMEAYVNDPQPGAAPAQPEKEEMKSTTEIDPKGKRLARARKAIKGQAFQERRSGPSPKKIHHDGTLTFTTMGITAKGNITGDKFIVLKGSGCLNNQNEFERKYPARAGLRKRLLENGCIVKVGESLTFKRNVTFNSATHAATIIAGAVYNGLLAWRDEVTGKTLKELA